MPSDDDEIYTGSILYMPDMGNVCRQLLFDNHNGQFTDNGYVDCERAAYPDGRLAQAVVSRSRTRHQRPVFAGKSLP